jgi:excisionase family DNA binding protein
MDADTKFMSAELAASRLGVPAAWLRREVEAGRITSLRAGRKLLVNPAEVEKQLLMRAEQDAGKGCDDGR